MEILFVLAIPLAIGSGIYYGKIVARPLEVPRNAPKPPFQFFLSDMLWLFVLLHPGMVVFGLARGSPDRAGWIVAAYVMFIGGALWLVGLLTLSRLGIMDVVRRAVFFLVFLPLFVVGSIGMLVAVIASAGLVHEMTSPFRFHRPSRREMMEQILFGPGALVVLPLIGVGCRRLAKWIRAGAAPIKEAGEVKCPYP